MLGILICGAFSRRTCRAIIRAREVQFLRMQHRVIRGSNFVADVALNRISPLRLGVTRSAGGGKLSTSVLECQQTSCPSTSSCP